MWTGVSALKNIDHSLQTIRNDVVRLDSKLTQLTASLTSGRRHRMTLLSNIAKVRLDEIESGALVTSLNSLDQQTVVILAERDEALETLNTRIDALHQSILDAEHLRDTLLETANQRSQKMVEMEAGVQSQLKQNSEYMAQFERASQAQSVSDEAEQKVERAQVNMGQKAKPYQADDLFMYLWGRGYGTTEYKGGLFFRFMDGWVARVIKYNASRVNYWNLTEIPKRLTEHADRVAEFADIEREALQALELSALESAGVEELKARLDDQQKQLDQHDDKLEGLELSLSTDLDSRALFVSGEDEYIKRSLGQMTQALQHQSLGEVHRYVQSTHSPTDDRMVLELQGLDDRADDIEEDLADVRVLHDKQLAKLRELETVRRDFKNSRFDDLRSGFGSEGLVSSVLGEFMKGVVSGADLWRTIERNQRYRNVGSTPDFGSDGLGGLGDILGPGRRKRAARRSTWNFPQPRRGGGGFKIPRAGNARSGNARGRNKSSGGGFTTGGSF